MTLEDKSKIHIKNNGVNLLEKFSLKPCNGIINLEFLKDHNKIINLFTKSKDKENNLDLEYLEDIRYYYKLTIGLYGLYYTNNNYSRRIFDSSYQFHEISLPILNYEFTLFNKDVYIPLYINLEYNENGFDDDEYYDENE